MNNVTWSLPVSDRHALKLSHTVKSGYEQTYLITSDIHFDAPECQRKMLKRDLEEAQQIGAGWIDNGDWFEVIGTRYDKRGGKSTIRPSNMKANYLDSLVEEATDWFTPYADILVCAGTGNHDAYVTNKLETNIHERFIKELNRVRSSELTPICHMGYGFWVRWAFAASSPSGASNKSSYLGKFFHGSGGDPQVTKGTITDERRQPVFPNADFLFTGHIHQRTNLESVKEWVTMSDEVTFKPVESVQTSTYRLDYSLNGAPSWHMMRGGRPKPLGGFWLTFKYNRTQGMYYELRKTQVDYNNLEH